MPKQPSTPTRRNRRTNATEQVNDNSNDKLSTSAPSSAQSDLPCLKQTIDDAYYGHMDEKAGKKGEARIDYFELTESIDEEDWNIQRKSIRLRVVLPKKLLAIVLAFLSGSVYYYLK